ncbi:MAG: hypothetical protein RL885_08820 [Planctomycetota bacterium]
MQRTPFLLFFATLVTLSSVLLWTTEAADDVSRRARIQIAEPEGFIIGAQLLDTFRDGDRTVVEIRIAERGHGVGRPVEGARVERHEFDADGNWVAYSFTAFAGGHVGRRDVEIEGGVATLRDEQDGKVVYEGTIDLPEHFVLLDLGEPLYRAGRAGKREILVLDPRRLQSMKIPIVPEELEDDGLSVRLEVGEGQEPTYQYSANGELVSVTAPKVRVEACDVTLACSVLSGCTREEVWSNDERREWWRESFGPLAWRAEEIETDLEDSVRSGELGPFDGLIKDGVIEGISRLGRRPAPEDSEDIRSISEEETERVGALNGDLVSDLLMLVPTDGRASLPDSESREIAAERLRLVHLAAVKRGARARTVTGFGYRPTMGGSYVRAEWVEIYLPWRAPLGETRFVGLVIDPAVGAAALSPGAYLPFWSNGRLVRMQKRIVPPSPDPDAARDPGVRKRAVLSFKLSGDPAGNADYEIQPAIEGPFGAESYYRGAIRIPGTLSAAFTGRSLTDGTPLTYRIDGDRGGLRYVRDCLFMPGRVVMTAIDGNSRSRRSYRIPDGATITDWNNLVHWTLMYGARPLEKGRTFDIVSFRPQDQKILEWSTTVEASGRVLFGGVETPAWRLAIEVDDKEVTLWTGQDGGLLRDEESRGTWITERVQ